MRILASVVAAAAFAAVALSVGPAEAGGCHPVFVAGEGVIDSCTGLHRSPYPDPPPEPTIIYVDVQVSPIITINNNVNVSTSSYSVSSSTASANAGAASSVNNTRVRPRVTFRP